MKTCLFVLALLISTIALSQNHEFYAYDGYWVQTTIEFNDKKNVGDKKAIGFEIVYDPSENNIRILKGRDVMWLEQVVDSNGTLIGQTAKEDATWKVSVSEDFIIVESWWFTSYYYKGEGTNYWGRYKEE